MYGLMVRTILRKTTYFFAEGFGLGATVPGKGVTLGDPGIGDTEGDCGTGVTVGGPTVNDRVMRLRLIFLPYSPVI